MDMPRPVALQDGPTVLLIADEPTRRLLLAEALQEEGFAVVQARTVHDGVRQAHAGGPDLIVLDLLPGAVAGPGLDRLRHDRATRGLPLIVIRRPGVRLDRGRRGASDALLSSPVDVDALLEHVWRVVNTRLLGTVNRHGRGDPPRLVRDGGSETAVRDPREP
jgi:DNA-binding response OmpR family regulator